MPPILSICIAAHNVEKYISECLLSIFQFENTISKEIIIVDDCSCDATVREIKSIIDAYPEQNILLIENSKNLGPGATYNRAVENTHGKYITFLDSDDFLIASGFEKKVEILEKNSELKIVYGNGVFFEKGAHGLQIQSHMDRLFQGEITDIQKKLYTTIPMLSVSCSVMRRDFFDEIQGFDIKCLSNDWVLNIRIFQHFLSKKNFSYILDPVFAYRMHDNSISKDQNRMIKLLKEVVDTYVPLKYKDIQYGNIYFFSALNLIMQYKYNSAFKLLRTSLSFDFRISRIFIFIFAIISPVRYISKNFPIFFSFLKKIIQSFS